MEKNGSEIIAAYETKIVPGTRPDGKSYFQRCGITWSRSTTLNPSFRILPINCSFDANGPCIFSKTDNKKEICYIVALANSIPFTVLTHLAQGLAAEGRKSYTPGAIARNPLPKYLPGLSSDKLASLAERGWSLKRKLDTVNEISHAFILPSYIRNGWVITIHQILKKNLTKYKMRLMTLFSIIWIY